MQTLEPLAKPYREFMENIIPLSLHFAYGWKMRHPDETLTDVITKRTILPELLRLNDEKGETLSEWNDFLADAERCLLENPPQEYFEAKMATLLMPLARHRFEKYYESRMALPGRFNAGSLKYDAPLEEFPRNYCCFHIANLVSPKSIFDDPHYLPQCFIALMNKSEQEYGYDTLYTFSWLNSRDKWLALFPREWRDNLSEPDDQVGGNLGYWGQLVAADAGINRRMADYVREHGELKYKPRRSHCSFKAMREHLEKYTAEIG